MSVRHPSELDRTQAAIECPTCRGATMVSETRRTANGLRRVRRCVERECPGRMTTLEVPAPDPRRWKGKQMVLVPIEELDTMAALIDSLRPANKEPIP